MEIRWHHVAMAVKDMERVVAFYRDFLNFEVDWEKPRYAGDGLAQVVGLEGAEARVVMLKGHGTRMELFQYLNPRGRRMGGRRQCDFGLSHMALQVKGIHEIYARLRAAGVVFNCPPQNLRPGVWATYLHDPEGNTVELVQYE